MIEQKLKAKAKMMRVVDAKTGESEYIPVVLLSDALEALKEMRLKNKNSDEKEVKNTSLEQVQ